MPYAIRDAQGRIIGLTELPHDGHNAALPADHPDVLAFLAHDGAKESAFLASDLALLRAVEDLIDVLITKNVIAWTDLPAAVQEKLLARRSLRDRLTDPLADEAKVI